MTAAVLALAVTGCLDALAPGNALQLNARIAIAPEFVGFESSSGIPSDIDSIEIVLTRPPATAAVVRVGVAIEEGQDSIMIPVTVPLEGAFTTYHVELLALSVGAPMYAGSQEVMVTAIPSAPAPIAAVYVGPGRAIRGITVAPTAVVLAPGDSVAFTWSGTDSAGNAMPRDSVPARFATSDARIVAVSRTGVVRGVALGTATVVITSVASAGVRDTAAVSVRQVEPPLIEISPTSVQFVDTALVARTVAVSNVGSGTLSGLTVGPVSYGAGQPTGWLSASLSGTTAPATLTLTAARGALAAGAYAATVPVRSGVAGNSPQAVTATFVVTSIPLRAIAVAPGFRVMLPGDTGTVAVSGTDASGNPLTPIGVTWISRSPAVVSVSAAGFVTAVAAGSAVIVAQAPAASGTLSDSLLVVVPAAGSAVVTALAGDRAFDAAGAGDTVAVLVAVDLRAVSSELLGSYNAQLTWNPAALSYMRWEPMPGGFAAPTVNETQTSTGQLRFGSADANGKGGTRALIGITFVAAGTGVNGLQLTLSDLSAAVTFRNLLPGAVVVSGNVTIR